jgi:lysophospholipase L1-like esterase
MARQVSPERPLSVVVLGNSLSVLSLPGRTGAEDGSYAEVLRDRLAKSGVPVRVHLAGRWFDFATSAVGRYEEDVRAQLPDVLIVQYGLNESQPWLIPIPVIRHLMSNQTARRPIGAWYRQRLQKRIWKVVRGYRKGASGIVGMRTWQTTPRRFHQAMHQIIRASRHDSRPLVLVLDIDAPGPALAHHLRKMPERNLVMQQVLRDVVAGFDDPDVRLVEVSKVRADAGPEATVDGMHYSPHGHQVVGEVLADEILGWL